MLQSSTWLKHTIVEHRWPLLALAPFAIAFEWLSDDAQLIVPVVAFAVGLILAPRHVWVLWASFAMLWIAGLGIWLLFNEPTSTSGGDESWLEVLPLTFFVSTLLVLLPAWLGRLLRSRVFHEHGRGETAGS